MCLGCINTQPRLKNKDIESDAYSLQLVCALESLLSLGTTMQPLSNDSFILKGSLNSHCPSGTSLQTHVPFGFN